MFKKISLQIFKCTLAFGFLFSIGVHAENQEPDFRKSRWGASVDAVKASETTKPAETDEDSLIYRGKLAGLDVSFRYTFSTNKLASAGYLFLEKRTDPADYIGDFTKMQELLTKKYGKPTDDRVIWKNDLYKNDPQRRGTALALGHLAYATEWRTERTIIQHVLGNDGSNIMHGMMYLDKAAEGRENEKREKREKEAQKDL